MKKIARLLLTVALLAAMLTVFAVPASAERLSYVGKWVNIDNTGALGTTDYTDAYCFAYDSASLGFYKIAIYIVGDNTIVSKDTIVDGVVGEVSTSLIPQAALAEAAKDYPKFFSTGSTLSEGSLTIVVGVACLAVGLVGGLLIGKKKKPKTATAEED